MYKTRDLLRLVAVPHLGPLKIRALLSHFGDPLEVLNSPPHLLIKVPGITRRIAGIIAHHTGAEEWVDRQLNGVRQLGGQIVTYWDTGYPDLLKKIYDPPPILFVLGKFEESDRHSVAVVGTRQPSHYGRLVTEALARDLTAVGITIVSGLARGIDTHAHRAALEAEGRTIAVVGSGLDIPYPPENTPLLKTIASCGAVVSEFPLGTPPDPSNFPRRNRIISGLSVGTAVIESAVDGGAMITASSALDQNREVFAVPGSILERQSIGPHTLIREGRATLIRDAHDLLAELQHPFVPTARETEEPALIHEVTLFEQSLLNHLSSLPIHVDELSELTGMASPDVLVTLLTMEFKGLVKQLPGKLFVRSEVRMAGRTIS